MPTFKYKTNKKIIVDDKSITTLDNRHKEMQLHFLNIKNIIVPNLLKEKKEKYLQLNLKCSFLNIFCLIFSLVEVYLFFIISLNLKIKFNFKIYN